MIQHLPSRNRIVITATLLLISGLSFGDNDERSSSAHRDTHTDVLEEIVVSAPFGRTVAESTQPINVIGGEAINEEIVNTLGEALKGEIGINNASFGTAVGHPVIRGQTGNRITVLQNKVGTLDVSNQSPDHVEGVDLSLTNKIEVIRGPASLLYGGGAIGGVINVIDGRIPESVPDKPALMIEQTYNENNSEDRTAFRLDAGRGNFAFHLEGFRRRSGDVDIPGFAID